MINIMMSVVAAVVTFSWCTWMAHREYARVIHNLSGQRLPAVYGHGWMSADDKRKFALQEALRMMAFWWAIHPYRWIVRVITGPACADPVRPDYDKIKELEHELGLTDPPEVVPWVRPDWDEPEADTQAPGVIRTSRPEDIRTVPCVSCTATRQLIYRWDGPFPVHMLANRILHPCTCGETISDVVGDDDVESFG